MCGTNLKQIGMAFEMYAQENQEYVPLACNNADYSWDNEGLGKYAGSMVNRIDYKLSGPNVFHCPSDAIVRDNGAAPRSYSRILFNPMGTYGYSNDDPAQGTRDRPYTGYSFPFPRNGVTGDWGAKVLSTEWHHLKNIRGGNQTECFIDGYYFRYAEFLGYGPVGRYHLNKSNFLYFDGHVAVVPRRGADYFEDVYWNTQAQFWMRN
jgi:prepilin-type processing-associated H-X9-DG protein